MRWAHRLAVPESPRAPTDRSLPRVGATLRPSTSMAIQDAEEGLRFIVLPSASIFQLCYEHCSLQRRVGGGNSLTREEGSYYDVHSVGTTERFFFPYFLVPKKWGAMRIILNLRVLDSAVFFLYADDQLLECIQPGNWMTSIDLTHAYFHVLFLRGTASAELPE